MSGYTSGNNAPTQMAQAPNRKGNISKTVTGPGGVTAVTRPQGGVAYSKGHVGAPAAGGKVDGRNQKVQVSTPAAYNTKATNTGYLKGSSFLK
jgi:hypothetical protein